MKLEFLSAFDVKTTWALRSLDKQIAIEKPGDFSLNFSCLVDR